MGRGMQTRRSIVTGRFLLVEGLLYQEIIPRA
jgi:hypothetical protein